jgi:hypothetical protein
VAVHPATAKTPQNAGRWWWFGGLRLGPDDPLAVRAKPRRLALHDPPVFVARLVCLLNVRPSLSRLNATNLRDTYTEHFSQGGLIGLAFLIAYATNILNRKPCCWVRFAFMEGAVLFSVSVVFNPRCPSQMTRIYARKMPLSATVSGNVLSARRLAVSQETHDPVCLAGLPFKHYAPVTMLIFRIRPRQTFIAAVVNVIAYPLHASPLGCYGLFVHVLPKMPAPIVHDAKAVGPHRLVTPINFAYCFFSHIRSSIDRLWLGLARW